MKWKRQTIAFVILLLREDTHKVLASNRLTHFKQTAKLTLRFLNLWLRLQINVIGIQYYLLMLRNLTLPGLSGIILYD